MKNQDYPLKLNLSEITKEVESLCRLAFEEIIEPKLSGNVRVDSKDKSGRNFVTEVDLATELFLKERLTKVVPEAGFIAEETASNFNAIGLNWIIDPIDGTTNFMHHAPPYCISVALAKDSEVLLGVVFEMFNQEMFTAWKGGGSNCNDKKIRVSVAEKLSESLLVTGFPYEQNELFDPWIELFAKLTRKTHGVRRYGAAAVDLCYVAAGRIDGYYEFNLNPWDVAAGSLIAQEAGANVTDFYNGDHFLFGKSLIATNGQIHQELAAEVADFAALLAEFNAR
ncbi:MAG: inositol monophosphatase [Salibacteraceae bacterium]|nr:inositol monophosphatase [Salibacteraceae bacterium]MDP4763480.1 inositol monophosphatase [Salibacteraceae bacterium]